MNKAPSPEADLSLCGSGESDPPPPSWGNLQGSFLGPQLFPTCLRSILRKLMIRLDGLDVLTS